MPAGGQDFMHVGDLSGTGVNVVNWELAALPATTATDKQADRVVVDGTFGNDAIDVSAGGPQVRVTGVSAAVEVTRSDPTLDSLHIDTKPGNDLLSVEPQVHNLIRFTSS